MSEPRVIRTEADYSEAIERFEALLAAQEGQPGYDERDMLATLIERYEDEHFPIDPPDPVDAEKFRAEQSRLT
jgi:HTH-type transcriptional regulator/antitoxin HigA